MRVLFILLLCIAPLSHAESLLDRLPGLSSSGQTAFLPPDQAFGLEIKVNDAKSLTANYRIAPTYYLYRDKIVLTVKKGSASIANLQMSKARSARPRTASAISR